MRTLSAELASFGVSTTLGIFVGSTLTNILGTMLILTPYGWVIALGVGLYAGFQASLTVNRLTKSITGSIYDRKLPF